MENSLRNKTEKSAILHKKSNADPYSIAFFIVIKSRYYLKLL